MIITMHVLCVMILCARVCRINVVLSTVQTDV
jgi:hypothetical protein